MGPARRPHEHQPGIGPAGALEPKLFISGPNGAFEKRLEPARCVGCFSLGFANFREPTAAYEGRRGRGEEGQAPKQRRTGICS